MGKFGEDYKITVVSTRKYPLRGYILGVLTHTTAGTDSGEVIFLKIVYT